MTDAPKFVWTEARWGWTLKVDGKTRGQVVKWDDRFMACLLGRPLEIRKYDTALEAQNAVEAALEKSHA